MSRARTIIIGASHWHVPLYADRISTEHEVIGVSDEVPARVEALAQRWRAPLFSSWEHLIDASQDVELAYVFAPHDTMREICLALINKGIPLVVEKPAAVSPGELSDIRAAAEASGVPIAIPLIQRAGPTERWLAKAGSSLYESVQFIAGPPDRYLNGGSPWMLQPERAGGGCMINLAPHFVDLFLQSTGGHQAIVTAAMSSALHNRDIEDYASLTLTTPDGRIGTVQVGYAFPASPLKRHCAFMRIGASGTATISSDGTASFTSVDGITESELVDVDSDPLYGQFVGQVAAQLDHGFAGLPGIRDLEATMTIIWDAYSQVRGEADNVRS
jgi:Predicted dehydrogenases and related proteins